MPKLKVAVFGCGGIIGTHLMISVPPDIEPLFVRKTPSPLAESLDLEDWGATEAWLNNRKPDVIVNLAGESRVDVVERDTKQFSRINMDVVVLLANWCAKHAAHLIQVSSQAVLDPVNKYGKQKKIADGMLDGYPGLSWTIVRPTFVLGIRPFPAIGRENPAEAMLAGTQLLQVSDRHFSISFAWDVAEILWETARQRPVGKVIHVGNPERLSRYELARMLNPSQPVTMATQEALEEQWHIAPRPLDTTYVNGEVLTPLGHGLQCLRELYAERIEDREGRRCKELAAFLRIPANVVHSKLMTGFGPLHNAVTWEFNQSGPPRTDEELLEWYRTTQAYLWELTAYHCDAGFNYSGMCEGIITRLKGDWEERALKDVNRETGMVSIVPPPRVLCLGDGVGTLTIKMKEAGLDPVYHDLTGSRTEAFSFARWAMRFKEDFPVMATKDWKPEAAIAEEVWDGFDAVCSLDFLEHVPNVEEWVRAIYAALKPGGLFCAQNGFAMGSGPDGAMPMHLQCNDRFEKDWDPLLTSVGFVQLASNWYQRPK